MRPFLLAFTIAALSAAPLVSQRPPSLGTAGGYGGAAVTQARRADAALWNPALVGVYDGPVRTTSLLGFDAPAVPGSSAFEAAARLGLLSGRAEDARVERLGGPLFWRGRSPNTAVQLRWVAVQSRDLAMTFDTRASVAVGVPEGLARELGVTGVAPEVWERGGASRSLTSVLTLARGTYLGRFPTVGRLWAGAAVKGWWVHEHATGAFLSDVPDVPVFRETVLGNAGGVGLDAGVAGVLAGDRVWYGVAVSNAYATTFQPHRAPRTRTVDVIVGPAGEVEFQEAKGPEIREDDPDAEAVARARTLWDETRFPTMVRAGVAWDAAWGLVALAASEQLSRGELDAAGLEPARTLAWSDRGGRFRVSYGWGRSRPAVAAAVSGGRCDRKWTAGLRHSPGTGVGLALDLSLSDWSCNLQGQGR
ncbi:MAG TPA: hypothetical protein VFR37_18420 [Longimicrobium sp.]|nr:hypothetical protein [Longimicrobium sp.]